MTLEVSGIVKDGKLPPAVSGQVVEALRRMEGKRVVLTLKEQKKRRSLNQNNFYFGVVVKRVTEALREVGNDMDEQETHEFLKDEVGKLSRVMVLPDGEVVKIKGSTKRLTTLEFEGYLDRVRAWGASMGIVLPMPNEDLTEGGIHEIGTQYRG